MPAERKGRSVWIPKRSVEREKNLHEQLYLDKNFRIFRNEIVI